MFGKLAKHIREGSGKKPHFLFFTGLIGTKCVGLATGFAICFADRRDRRSVVRPHLRPKPGPFGGRVLSKVMKLLAEGAAGYRSL